MNYHGLNNLYLDFILAFYVQRGLKDEKFVRDGYLK